MTLSFWVAFTYRLITICVTYIVAAHLERAIGPVLLSGLILTKQGLFSAYKCDRVKLICVPFDFKFYSIWI